MNTVPGKTQIKNLDVLRTSHDPEIGCTKGVAGKLDPTPLLYSLGAHTAQPDQQPKHRRQYRPGGTRSITVPQATNIIEAVGFAKMVGLHLVAHLTIYWACTYVGDDPYGKLFANVREGFNKWLIRHGIVFAGAWARENPGGDIEHCHLLFHLPDEWCTGARRLQLEAALYRLIKHHGRGYWEDRVLKLVIHDNPDGKYLIKGGGPKVWKLFRLRKEHRRLQGVIHGKRCGTTQNIGPVARRRALAADKQRWVA